MKMKTKEMVLCSLFAAIICISAVFTIPLPFTPVPITLQVMAICVAGAVLGAKNGTISVAIYVILGFIGVPVFSGMKSGPGVLFGVTGGYIFGFIPAAFTIGYLSAKFIGCEDGMSLKYAKLAIFMILGLIVIYVVGTAQFMAVTGMNVIESLSAAVLPFVALDLLKIVLAVIVSYAIKQHIYNFNVEQIQK